MINNVLIALEIIQIILILPILYYVTRPKIIEIEKMPTGTKSQAIMTPSGTFMRFEKREPVINDDETLVLRDDSI